MSYHCVRYPNYFNCKSSKFLCGMLMLTLLSIFMATASIAQSTNNLMGYGVKIFRVESGLYPFVHVYARTFDQNMEPLINLNELNIGVMVKGHAYDVRKRQYVVQSIRNRNESIRTVLVMDTSKTMQGEPFDGVRKAMIRFIDHKRKQDQVGIIATADNTEGYNIVSNFEIDVPTLGRRFADIAPDGRTTSLYDTIGAAMQMCASAPVGGIVSEEADYTASCSIVVFSDGKDEGSSLSRSDLMNRISNFKTPIPIYSLAYSRVGQQYLKNLQALSKNSFGKYFDVGKSSADMVRSLESIHNIIQNDYVITFRSYLPIDGEEHAFKIGIEYPSRSGRFRYQGARFEAVEPISMFSKVRQYMEILSNRLPLLSDNNPYLQQKSSVAVRSELPLTGKE